MRTTLTIDDDVLAAVKERARFESRTAGEVLSDLARQSLTRPSSQPTSAKATLTRSGFRTLPSRGGVVTSQLVDDLLDEGDS